MAPLPRKKCPFCKRSVPMRVSGEFREHTLAAGADKCPASGATMVEARTLIASEERAGK